MPEEKKIYPAFGKQLSNWFSYTKNKGKKVAPNVLITALAFREIDKKIALLAFDELIRRHESLRTTFTLTAEGVMQVVSTCNHSGPALLITSCKSRKHLDKKRKIFIRQTEKTLRDLETGPLFKGILYEVANEGYYLELIIHHIIADAWSIKLMKDELLRIYHSLKTPHPGQLPPNPAQLREYAQKYHNKKTEEKVKTYWTKRLRTMPAAANWRQLYETYNTTINTDVKRNIYRPRIATDAATILKVLASGDGHTFSTHTKGDAMEKIIQLTTRHNTTISIIVLASFLILTRNLFRTHRTLIISRLNGRFDPFSHHLIGNFTCAIYSYIEARNIKELRRFVSLTLNDLLDSLEYAVYNPLILKDIPLTANCHLCVNVMNNDQTNMHERPEKSSQTPLKTYFPIENTVVIYKDSINFNWVYNTALFRSSIVQFIADEHLKVLNKMVSGHSF